MEKENKVQRQIKEGYKNAVRTGMSLADRKDAGRVNHSLGDMASKASVLKVGVWEGQ